MMIDYIDSSVVISWYERTITLYNPLTTVAWIFPLRRSLNRQISCVTSRHSCPIVDSKRIQIRFHLLHPRRTILHSQGEDGHPRLLCFSKSRHGEAPAPKIVVNYIIHSNRDPSPIRACHEVRLSRYKGCRERHINTSVR